MMHFCIGANGRMKADSFGDLFRLFQIAAGAGTGKLALRKTDRAGWKEFRGDCKHR